MYFTIAVELRHAIAECNECWVSNISTLIPPLETHR